MRSTKDIFINLKKSDENKILISPRKDGDDGFSGKDINILQVSDPTTVPVTSNKQAITSSEGFDFTEKCVIHESVRRTNDTRVNPNQKAKKTTTSIQDNHFNQIEPQQQRRRRTFCSIQ